MDFDSVDSFQIWLGAYSIRIADSMFVTHRVISKFGCLLKEFDLILNAKNNKKIK